MIQEFIDSWPLFADTYLTGWLIAVLLSMVGVVVLAEDQVFIGAAVAQASTLGIAVTLWIGGMIGREVGEHGVATAAAVAFAIAAALLTTRPPGQGRDSREAVTGWVFLASSSLAVLLLTNSPHGMDEIHKLLASTIIGSTWTDVWMFGAAGVVTAAALGVAHRAIALIVMDGQTASALGVRVRLWSPLMAAWLGLTLGLAMHAGGLLYCFGCLVLPPMIARNLCRRVAPMFWVAPVVALVAAAAGFILANRFDYPPGQTAVALLSVLLPLAWCVRLVRR